MITTTDTVLVVVGSIEMYDAPDLVCFPRYDVETEYALVEVSIRNSTGEHLRYAEFLISKVDIDAQTITATDNTDVWMEAIDKVVKEKLESLNPTATFTIA
jgi:hypothetical protein